MRLLFVLILTCIITCCKKNTDYNDSRKYILLSAGSNKNEIELVFKYFDNSNDTLKKNAAEFLLSNMIGLKTLDSVSVMNNNRYYDCMERENWLTQKKITSSRVYAIIDSLNNISEPTMLMPKYVDDIKTLSSIDIINNIEKSFYIWRTAAWSKKVPFNDFCKYILPYRSVGSYDMMSRDFFFNKYKYLLDSLKEEVNPRKVAKIIIQDIDSKFTEDFTLFSKFSYLKPMTFSNLLKAKIGTCNDINSVKISALRSMGIPVSYDYILNWANSNSSHSWCTIVDSIYSEKVNLLSNIHKPESTEHIISGSSYNMCKDYSGVPAEVSMYYNRTVAKVYREEFERKFVERSSLVGYHKDFQNDRMLDVTQEYVECDDIELEVHSGAENSNAYLMCFDNENWVPVAVSKIKNRKVYFQSTGKNIVYMVSGYNGSNFTPVSDPFLFIGRDEIRFFNPNTTKLQNIKLYNKYPFRSVVKLWFSFMIGGRFKFANKNDFSDSINVYEVDKIPFYRKDVDVHQNIKYRYLIFDFTNLDRVDVGDIRFYEKVDGEDKIIEGTRIGNKGLYNFSLTEAFDGNNLTYFMDNKDDDKKYIGIDLGYNKKKQVSKISIVPRNDGNGVLTGDLYELFFWNKKWISLGLRKAVDNCVYFENIPTNSILLLKDSVGGKENRIFTITKGRQMFW